MHRFSHGRLTAVLLALCLVLTSFGGALAAEPVFTLDIADNQQNIYPGFTFKTTVTLQQAQDDFGGFQLDVKFDNTKVKVVDGGVVFKKANILDATDIEDAGSIPEDDVDILGMWNEFTDPTDATGKTTILRLVCLNVAGIQNPTSGASVSRGGLADITFEVLPDITQTHTGIGNTPTALVALDDTNSEVLTAENQEIPDAVQDTPPTITVVVNDDPDDPNYGLDYMIGDPDGNTITNALDAMKMLRHVVLTQVIPTGSNPFMAADVDENGSINVVDVMAVLRWVVLLKPYPQI